MTAKNVIDNEDICDEVEATDSHLPVVCDENRHHGKIEGSTLCLQCWRMKERMKTVSVALVLCLNVGVDPPDVVKISPCARMECWIDPSTMSPQKALESIGSNLQKQYERWQPRARYKQSLDPTVEEVKKLCTSLRRNAKEERVLFHYIGHGVPKPTSNGEVWVFNKSYTQYIPLSLYDLQIWMGSPSIYVFDCSNAGIIIDLFKTFTSQREQEAVSGQMHPLICVPVITKGLNEMPHRNRMKENLNHTRNQERLKKSSRITELSRPRWVTNRGPPPGPEATGQMNGEQSAPSSIKNSILLAACGATEHLPMNPDLPADLFTSCLTTPIKVALRWYVLQNGSLVPGLTMEMVDKIPGQLSDRRTMLGELNWIFTAITDTIAWNSLPRELFQKLFRQDLLVASLFRNFLLAERIMRSYNCVPISNPKLPLTHQHPMWQAWDLALDLCLQQLTHKPIADNAAFSHSPFFAEQLTAFKVWLDYGSETRRPPEQLPIVLQVLLSQVHRVRALDLLGKFLDLGPWAVNLALSVGIFPYVLKLLQSSARELRPLLVFIWAKILAVDPSCQADLVKDSGHKYFLNVLSESSMAPEHRTMAAFVMAIIMNNYPQGREAALQDNTISTCLVQLGDPDPHLRQWLALCLAKVWTNFDNARWCGVRDRAHEKLSKLLSDSEPEVRAATVYALGSFISRSSEQTEHSVTVDSKVSNLLVACSTDGSPLVRKELVVAFCGFVSMYLNQFVSLVKRILEEEMERMSVSLDAAGLPGVAKEGQRPLDGLTNTPLKRSASRGSFKTLTTSAPNQHIPSLVNSASSDSLCDDRQGLRRVSSGAILTAPFVSVYKTVWHCLVELTYDPHPEVASMSKAITEAVKRKASVKTRPRPVMQAVQNNHSTPSSPSNRPPNMYIGTPPQNIMSSPSGTSPYNNMHLAQSSRRMYDKMPSMVMLPQLEDKEDDQTSISNMASTKFFEWSCKYFQEPVMCLNKLQDSECKAYHEVQYRFLRNKNVRQMGRDQCQAGVAKLDEQIFVNKVGAVPTAIEFHPYENVLAVADNFNVSFWDLEQGTRVSDIPNPSVQEKTSSTVFRISRITSVNFINSHDQALFMFSTDDGAIRLYRNFLSSNEGSRELVTAFKGLSEIVPSERGSGLVTEWEQESSTLIASGNARMIRLWDIQRETKISDIYTGAESCVTSLASDPSGKSLLIAGCGDGSVRLFDRRLNPSECRVMTLREHDSWVLKVHLQRGPDGNIISACYDGDIRFWDPRFTDSVRVYSTPTTLSSVDIHPRADIIACGSTNQTLTTYDPKGSVLSTVKYHEGFLGQRIGNASCMAFHPHQIKLATGSADTFISIYATPSQRNNATL